MVINNQTKGCIIAGNIITANTFLSRFIGLMGRKELPEGHGLLITPCNSIHMFFMKFPIDAVFLDKRNTVVFIIENIMPWQISKIIYNASSVLELPAGSVASSGTAVGDKLAFSRL